MLLVGAGGYGFWRQYPAAMVGRVCAGMLPVDPVLDLSGESRFSLIGFGFLLGQYEEEVSSRSVNVNCDAGNASVHIENPSDRSTNFSIRMFRDQDSFPLPLEAGWSGFVLDADGTASVLVGCRNWGSGDGTGIAVTVKVDQPESVPDMRRKLVRAVVGTARSAVEQTGCDAQLGGDAELAVPGGTDRTVPAAEASGTCAGMTSAEMVRESDAGTAPVEECVLVDGLSLIATYGEYKEAYLGRNPAIDRPSGAYESSAWTSATCATSLDPGFYRASVLKDTDPDFGEDPLDDAQLADLQRFAQQSAARHGCTPPLPIDRER